MSSYKKAIIAGIVGNGIFGFSFLFSKIALQYADPVLLLALRFDIACLTMTILAVMGVIKLRYRGKDLRLLLLLGFLQPIVYFLCENFGLNHTSSSIAGVLIAIIPVVSFFTGFLFLRETFQLRQFLWAILSLLGVSVISLAGQSEGNLEMIGLLLLLAAVVSAAIYNTISRRISADFSAAERTYMMFFMGAVFFTALSVATSGGQWMIKAAEALSHRAFLVTVAYLGAVSSIVGFFSLNYSVGYLPVRQATSFASITPIISVSAGMVVLRESVSWIQIAGIILILVGVYKVNQ